MDCEARTIIEIARFDPPPTWEEVCKISDNNLADLSEVLEEQIANGAPWYPLKADIFNAFRKTPLPNVRVVIVGQDPYHQLITLNGRAIPRACGLSFGVRKGDEIPESLAFKSAPFSINISAKIGDLNSAASNKFT